MFENQKPEIDYPCNWEFKLIGEDQHKMESAILQLLGKREHFLEKSMVSKKGRYISLRLDLLVESEEDRNAVFAAFKQHEAFKMVL